MTDRTRRDDTQPVRRTVRDDERPTPPPTSLDGTQLQPENRPEFLQQLPRALAEHYDIVEELETKGAEADLFIVEHRTGGDKLVAKIYRHGVSIKKDILDRVVGADPDHVVRLVDHGTSDGRDYELQEYVRLGTLDDLIRDEGPALDEDLAREILLELLVAMEHLHDNDIVHRDLKPANILVRERAPLDLILTDFGISSLMQGASEHFTSKSCTLAYSAPEADTGQIFEASDFWSIGIIAAEIVGGRNPYAGFTDPVISSSKATLPVELPEMPAHWEKLCRGLLIRDPRERWGADHVRRWLDGDETLPDPEAQWGRTSARDDMRPCVFKGQEYRSAEALAQGFTVQWDEGIKYIEHGHLYEWLHDDLHNQELMVLSEELDHDTTISNHTKLFRMIRRMNPELPPVFRSITLTRENLVALAHGAMNEEIKPQEILIAMMSDDVLAELRDHPASRDVVRANREWREAEQRYGRLRAEAESKGPGQHADSYQSRGMRLGILLLGALDENFLKSLRKQTAKQIAGSARDTTWYADLGNPSRSDAPALLLMQELHETAAGLAETQRQEKRRQRDAMRRERRAVARRRTAKAGRILSHLVFFALPVLLGYYLLQRYELTLLKPPLEIPVPEGFTLPQWTNLTLIYPAPQALMLIGFIAAELFSLGMGAGAAGMKRFGRAFVMCLFSPIVLSVFLAGLLWGADALAGVVGGKVPKVATFSENPENRRHVVLGCVGLAYLILWVKMNAKRTARK